MRVLASTRRPVVGSQPRGSTPSAQSVPARASGVADMFSWGGVALVVALSTAPVTTTTGAVAAPPSPRSTATAAALVTTPAKSSPSAIRTTDPVAASVSPSARLAGGVKIVLNPGHNGGNASHPGVINRQVPAGFGRNKSCDTTGTATNAGFSEHAFNWDVSLRVRNILQSRGVTVIMTRPSDGGVGPCVDQRARIGNQAGVAGVVSIHADGALSSGHGFHVSEASRPPHGAAVAAASHRLTVALHHALRAGSGMTTSTYLGSNGFFPRSDLAALNLATVPATVLEIGNMRNPGDAAIQTSSSGRQRIAVAVANGILRWLGL
jgi:N-acetylmuramoyl-L-alanine amidase